MMIIDLGRKNNCDKRTINEMSEQIYSASHDLGFYYIKAHAIEQAMISEILRLSEAFFSLPVNEKMKYDITKTKHVRGYGGFDSEQLDPKNPADYKESYDIGYPLPEHHQDVINDVPLRGANVYPSIDGWKETFESYYNHMHCLSVDMLKLYSISLGLSSEYFSSRLVEPLSKLRVLRYSPRPEHNVMGVNDILAGAHTDYGLFTILWQDHTGGLQVEKDGVWIDIPYVPGTFIVNTGDMFVRYTAGFFRSSKHRVVKNSESFRYSIPFFVEPNPKTIISTLPSFGSSRGSAKFEPVTAIDYMIGRFNETYPSRTSR